MTPLSLLLVNPLFDRAFDRWDETFNSEFEKGTPKGQAEQYISVLHNSRTPSENGQIIDNTLKTESNEAVRRAEVLADEKRKYHAEVEQKASASASESVH